MISIRLQLIGEDKRVLEELKRLDSNIDVEILPESKAFEYNITKTPALIIDNVVVSDIDLLSSSDLKNVFDSLG